MHPFGHLFLVGFALMGGTPFAIAAEAPRVGATTRQRLMQSLPAYDPAAKTAGGDQPGPAPISPGRRSKGAVRERKAEAPTELPALIVEAPRDRQRSRPLPAPLPAPRQIARFHQVDPEPFESEEMTERRLAKTYLSDLDRHLLSRLTLPFVGRSQGNRAKELARIDESAESLNRLAQIIAALEASGLSPEEAKAMREEYARLFLTRPK